MVDQLKPGWYPNNDGSNRYWDGNQWLSIPEPEQQTPHKKPLFRSKKHKILTFSIIGVLLLIGIASVAGFAVNKRNVELAQIAVDQKQKDEEARAAEAAAEKEAADRELRSSTVSEIEKSVKKMASSHAKEGLLERKPLKGIDPSCEPVDGSFDNLLSATTTFQCFVSTKDNKDGTSSGHYYHATVNWESGEYSFGLGAP